jgi:hypothetical protein
MRGGLKRGGKDQRDRRECEHRRLGARSNRIKVLLRTTQPSSKHGGAEHQQDIPNNATGYRSFHYIVEPSTQRDESNNKFGGIAKSRIKKPSNPFAHAIRKLFRGTAHPPRKGQNGNGGGYENEEMTLGC